MNDMDPSRTVFTYGTMPIGLEVQMTVYGYTHLSLADVIFKKYLIINKGDNIVEEMYLGYFSDPELGYGDDDYVGCDTLLNLAYCYNADSIDQGYYGYGENPPAVGYLLLQGTTVKGSSSDSVSNNKWTHGIKDQRMTSFSTYFNDDSFPPPCWIVSGNSQQYNYLNGLRCDGSTYISPLDSMSTKYPFSGNPIDSIGWYMGYQNLIGGEDWIMYMNTGSNYDGTR